MYLIHVGDIVIKCSYAIFVYILLVIDTLHINPYIASFNVTDMCSMFRQIHYQLYSVSLLEFRT